MSDGHRRIKRYGWKPSLPDHRDLIADTTDLTPLPEVDPRDEMPEPFDQGQLGSCFPAGTLIRMADGSERPIEDVRLGEYVVTAEGLTGMVRQTLLRLETEGLVKLSLWGYSALGLTAEHPVLTKRGYVPAGALTLDDWVALPRYAPPPGADVDVEALVAKHERTIKAGIRKMGVLHGRADVAVRVSSLPSRIALTPRFGFLVGLFLAEGSTDSGKVRWTFGAHEHETLVPRTVDLLTDLGVEAYVQRRPNNSINVVVYGTAWGRLWERLCGTGAGEKTVSPVLAGDQAFRRSILDGWLAGDGYNRQKVGNSTRTVGTTVSQRLAMAIYDIAQAEGLRPVLRRERAKVNDSAGLRRDFYTVEMTAQSDNWRCEQTDSHVFRRVRQLEHVQFAGHVYNLSVEGHESYVAEGVGVHNCTANAVAGALEYDAILDGAAATTPSRLFIYYCERRIEGSLGQGDTGAYGRDGFKAARRYGTPPETEWPYDIAAYANDPPDQVWTDAATHKLSKHYKSVPRSVNQFRLVLSNRQTIAFGFSVYDSFESDEVKRTGIVPMPAPSERHLGGHEVLAVGYLAAQPNYVLVRNSWGTGWGLGGYFLMPWQYLLSVDLASDFRTIVRPLA
jgi:Papain family cysteine protease